MLKAKILDATRRALLSQRIAHIWTQTDPIPTKEKQVETDGSVTIKKESPGGFILTQTIGLSTDNILINNVATQTARPKTSLSFGTFPYGNNSVNESTFGTVEDNILRNAHSLETQVQDIKRLEDKLWNKSEPDHVDNDIASEPKNEVNDESREVEFSDDSLSDNGKADFDGGSRKQSNDSYDVQPDKNREKFLNAPTLTSWTGFESNDDDEYDLPQLPKQTISEGYAPWHNFKDILIGNRLANMHLSPLPPRRTNIKRKSVTWSDAQHQAVSELMFEATALLDVFDNVAMLIGPDLNVKLTPNAKFESLKLPESKWQPLLEKSTKELDECLRRFRPHVFSKSFDVDDLNI
ncbi:hypothetical protein HA402_007881 [Bradysia odoriphaga]|nr:hypothetical protein HA402_007881 [Bradysia odoriphaga]